MATKKQSDAAKKEAAGATRPRLKRQVFAEGHKRKFLVVVDETPECESALAFAASRALRTKGQLALLYVVEPGTDLPHFLGIEEIAREEGHNKARAVFRLFGRKLKAMGFEDVVPEEIVREGMKADEITKLIEEDEDLGVLVLGARRTRQGLTASSPPWPVGGLPVPSCAHHRGAGPSLDRRDPGAGLPSCRTHPRRGYWRRMLVGSMP
jgi:nucleotide-binding universal stress UspA family protein